MGEQTTRTRENTAAPRRFSSRARAEGDAFLPLSPLQEQLWFLDRLAPGKHAYHVTRVVRLTGPLDVEALDRAFADLVRRHEILRTVFTVEAGRPTQKVLSVGAARLVVEDISDLPEERRDAEARRKATEAIRTPFDLERGPLVRLLLLRLDPTTHLLVLAIHHICADGWSMPIFCRDLSEFYNVHRADRPPELPDLPLQFGDFTLWQRSQMEDPAFQTHVDYWVERLHGLQPLELPTDRARPAALSYESDAVSITLESELLDGLRSLAERSNVTLLMALVAVFKAVLARYTGESEIVIGTATTGRPTSELAPLIGPFINMLVLRTDVSGDPTFAELLARAKETTVEAWKHRSVPLEQVVAAVQPAREPNRNPLFQVGLQLLDASRSVSLSVPTFDGVHAEGVEVELGGHPLDLSLSAVELDDGLILRADYSTDLFDRSRVVRLLGHVERVVRAVVVDAGLRVSELPLLSGEERRLLVEEWGCGPAVEQSGEPVHVHVAARATADPGAVAARFAGEELTYGELDRRAGLLARRLRELGVGRGDVVAVALERGLELLVALVGVLKAGGAFVVLDPGHPPRRLSFILGDTAARVVLTTSRLVGRLPEPDGWTPVCLDVEEDWLSAVADGEFEEWAGEGSPAYVLYTSGSTGQPKGVLVEHHALTTFLLWLRGVFGLGPGDRMAQHMALIFDFSIGEIFTVLTAGATLVFVPEEQRVDPEAFADLLERERITYLGGPPALLGAIPIRPYPELRYIVAGGEALQGNVVTRWLAPGRRFINGYGPTEAAVGCIFYECEHRVWKSQPPIGRPMPRRFAYVLDRWDNLCPIGVPGEIVVGGAGLARGYLNQPELTATRFFDDPVRPGGRVYRTGDLGLWSEEGQIRFLGRIDSQVKLNGLRIELEEIESALQLHPLVKAAAVAVRENGAGGKQLVGYVVSADGQLDLAALRTFLSEELPHYMIPSRFVQLEALSLTSVGKIDRAALPAAAPEEPADEPAHVPPSTPTEQRVAAIFAEILGRDEIGAHDNFFTLGGSSLQAARAVLQLREAFSVEVAVRDFYAAPRVSDVGRAIDEAGGAQQDDPYEAKREEVEELRRRLQEAEAELRRAELGQVRRGSEQEVVIQRREDRSRAPLSFTQEQLWFLDQLTPGRATYNIPLVMRLLGRLDAEAVRRALSALVARHEPFRTSFAVEGGRPYQVIHPLEEFSLPLEDWSWRSEQEQSEALQAWLVEEAERAFDRLPILADALEEAGCDHPDVLAHCRGPGPHARGCWVVDLVLGKE